MLIIPMMMMMMTIQTRATNFILFLAFVFVPFFLLQIELQVFLNQHSSNNRLLSHLTSVTQINHQTQWNSILSLWCWCCSPNLCERPGWVISASLPWFWVRIPEFTKVWGSTRLGRPPNNHQDVPNGLSGLGQNVLFIQFILAHIVCSCLSFYLLCYPSKLLSSVCRICVSTVSLFFNWII